MENQQPILSVKPVFLLLPELLVQLPFLLFFTIWAGGFFGGFSIVLLSILYPSLQSNMEQIAPFLFGFWGLLGGPLGLSFYLYTKKKRLQKTICEFYDDHLLITQVTDDANKQKTIQIDYAKITRIAIYKCWFQKQEELGSVCFSDKNSFYYVIQNLYWAYPLWMADVFPNPYGIEMLLPLEVLLHMKRVTLGNIPKAKEVYALLQEKTQR